MRMIQIGTKSIGQNEEEIYLREEVIGKSVDKKG